MIEGNHRPIGCLEYAMCRNWLNTSGGAANPVRPGELRHRSSGWIPGASGQALFQRRVWLLAEDDDDSSTSLFVQLALKPVKKPMDWSIMWLAWRHLPLVTIV